ncbi:guanylate cyclase domain-containing protein, partial [Haematococcus lacustris]
AIHISAMSLGAVAAAWPGAAAQSLHEVTVAPLTDPESGQQVLLVVQSDVSERSGLEDRLVTLAAAQTSMLEAMHVLERLMRCAAPSSSPGPVGSSLTQQLDVAALATHHECVTIMFTDIVGFTTMSKECQPAQVMSFLNELFSQLDQLVNKHAVFKVETAGDCYIVCGGLLDEDEDGFMTVSSGQQNGAARTRAARRVLNFAADMMQARFGDTMNTASRMESTSLPGRIQVSQPTYELLGDPQPERWQSTGGIEVKDVTLSGSKHKPGRE